MASRKVPAFRTCSQVRVVKLAVVDTISRGAFGSGPRKKRPIDIKKNIEQLTAERSDGSIDGLDKDTFAMNLLTVSYPAFGEAKKRGPSGKARSGTTYAHLLEALCVKQNPAQFDNLSRILCDVDAMLVAGGSYVDHHEAVEIEGESRLGCHGEGGIQSVRRQERKLYRISGMERRGPAQISQTSCTHGKMPACGSGDRGFVTFIFFLVEATNGGSPETR